MADLYRNNLIIYNPRAGRRNGFKVAKKLQKEFALYGGTIHEMFCANSLDAMRKFHQENAGNKNNYTLIIIIGGDGTIGPNVDAMIKNNIKVPVFPFGRGTANDFSSFLKTNVSIKQAACIIANGKTMDVDTLKVSMPNNENHVNYAVSDAAGGAFTCGVMKYKGKRILGRWGYLLRAGWHALWMKSQHVKFSVDNESFQEHVFLFYIINTKHVGSIKGAAPLARINDRVLDLVCIVKCGLWGRFCIGISALFGRLHKSKRIRYRQGKQFRVEIVGKAIRNFTITDTDGNIGGNYPLDVQIGPQISVVFNKNAKIH